ncbi:serine hydrolase [Sinomicrobium pectinilyticum]|nr:serine hydrolase [Sinomicrobium pectinilyticum]
MKKGFLIACLTAISVLPVSCNKGTDSRLATGDIEKLDAYVEELQQKLPLPCLGVVVMKGKDIYLRATGHRIFSEGQKAVFSERTPFFAGDLSGLLVVTAIARLADEGKLDMDAPVVDYLPYFALADTDIRGIKIKHLINQTGGIPGHSVMWDLPDLSDSALESTTRSIHLQQPEFVPPGSRVKRSPYNFDILADLIAKVTGMAFEDYMKTGVLEPLRMKDSFFPKDETFKASVAWPHAIKNWLTYTTDTVGAYPLNRQHSGSMGWHTSLRDLSGWLFMIMHKGKTAEGARFLTRSTGEKLLAWQRTGEMTAMGYGWEVIPAKTRTMYYKEHSTGNFTAGITMIPSDELAVAVVSNITGDFNTESVRNGIIRWLDREQETPGEVKPLLAAALGQRLEVTGQMDSVFRLYERLKRKKTGAYDYSVLSLEQLGTNLLYRLGEPEKALSFFRYCEQVFPGSDAIKLDLAEASIMNSDSRNAAAYLDQIDTIKPGTPEAGMRVRLLRTALKNRDSAVTKRE